VTPVDVTVVAAAVLAAVGYGVVRAPWGEWRRAVQAALQRHLAARRDASAGGQHRYEDAHTGSVSATAILRAMNAQVGSR